MNDRSWLVRVRIERGTSPSPLVRYLNFVIATRCRATAEQAVAKFLGVKFGGPVTTELVAPIPPRETQREWNRFEMAPGVTGHFVPEEKAFGLIHALGSKTARLNDLPVAVKR